MKLDVPDVLKREHSKLLLDLRTAAIGSGPVAEAAGHLLGLMLEHLRREEEYAFRLLGLLPHLVDGTVGEEMAAALPATDRLRTELYRLRQDHIAIVGAIGRLTEADRKEGRGEHARLADELLEHARVEEAILYPAALIIGEYVRLRLAEIEPKRSSIARAQ
jgi:hypothetical protein